MYCRPARLPARQALESCPASKRGGQLREMTKWSPWRSSSGRPADSALAQLPCEPSKRPQGIAGCWRALVGIGWHWMTLSGYWQALAGIWQAFRRHSAGIQLEFSRNSAGIQQALAGSAAAWAFRAALDSSKDKIDERTVLSGLRRCRMTPLVFQGVRESVLRTGVPLYSRATLPLTAGHRQQLAPVIR